MAQARPTSRSVQVAKPLDVQRLEAFLFDLDGVLTKTATVHARAWKRMFDDYLAARAAGAGEPFVPFDVTTDYLRYVDGKPRYEGVRSFLDSRGVTLPDGSPGDPASRETIAGLGNRKQRYFEELLATEGVEVFPDAAALVHELKRHAMPTAVVTSSRNCDDVLRAAGLDGLFDVSIDGVEAARRGLRGKPEPDTFLEAARRLRAAPARSVVFEDALSGVEAGRRGGFHVVGVDRVGQTEALSRGGADIVMSDLTEFGDLMRERWR